MKFRGIVFSLTVVTTIVSLYYLSFTFVDYRIQRQAEQQAMDEAGKIDFDRQQVYLMEIWKKPVYRLFGLTYTYEEVKERALKLGLDLQGGMHVTMELMPVDLVKGLATDPSDPIFLEALKWSQQERIKGNTTAFSRLFVTAYKRLAPENDIRHVLLPPKRPAKPYADEKDVLVAIDQEIEQAISRSMTIIQSRLDRFGAMQPTIRRLSDRGRIQIELPGVTNPERVRKLLQGVAQLRFWEIAERDEYSAQLDKVDAVLLEVEKQTLESTLPSSLTKEEKAQQFPQQSLLKRLIKGHAPNGIVYAAQDVEQINNLLHKEEVQQQLPKYIAWMWGKTAKSLDNGTQIITLYPIKPSKEQKPLLEGNIITNARQVFLENDPSKPAVEMQMNSQGARIWRYVTATHIGKFIAITLDDRVYTAPIVNQEIPNGVSTITSEKNFTLEEAKDLASVLQTGSLPAPLKIVEEVIMGPTLGKLAQKQGLIATAIGLALVLFFIVAYYAKGGIIAGGALLLNLLFIVGVLAQLDATLTLPGIAGLVLTIGMSIDANVLIFERIREELANKVPMKEAIDRGYNKSYSSIMDANITTFFAGAILYALGQGQVRGFAIILMIGIVSSIFASIFITRLFFSYYTDWYPAVYLTFAFRRLPKLFHTISFNFTRNRYYFYFFSLAIISIGSVCYYYRGLTWGVDFAGGRSYVVCFNKPVDSSWLKEALTTKLAEGVTVRTYGSNNIVQITTSYLIQEDTTAADKEVTHKLVSALEAITQAVMQKGGEGHVFHITSSTKVGAAMAKDVQKSARKAIILALIVIFIYVAVRFRKWKYGLASIIALIHDALVVLAGFCIANALGFSYEINEVFLAALLTVVGYSINDTVVIFDRIREKLAHTGSIAVDTMFINHAIRETLSRTVITSLTTLLVIIMLFCFGGEALQGFSFALLLGVVFGTYSSICIAAPLLVDIGNKTST